MGSRAKNSGQQQQQAATSPGQTPVVSAPGPMTSAPMTAYLRKNPVSNTPDKNFVPGVTDRGPKLPGMTPGYDSHGLMIPQQIDPRLELARLVNPMPWRTGGSGSDPGGYSTSGRGGSGSSSSASGGGFRGF